MQRRSQNIKLQEIILLLAILLFVVKITAWFLTGSLAILTDALESIVNIIAGGVGLYSLYLSAKPKDANHPYGHGKAEFVSAGLEGFLILLAGIYIIYKAVESFFIPHEIQRLSLGLIFISGTAVVNFIAGFVCFKTGKENDSLQLIAGGKHLIIDGWSTVAILAGLFLVSVTGIKFIDSIIAIAISVFIILNGYTIVRFSLSGIMDETDTKLLQQIVEQINSQRAENWIDVHNMRVIKYGNKLHCDCHLTVPWYLSVREGHEEMEALAALVSDRFGESVEFFVHVDPCEEFSCEICVKHNCMVRQHQFIKRIELTIENITEDRKHRLGDT